MASLNPINGPLGRRRAIHLLKRASFGGTRAEIDQFAGLTVQEAFDLLATPLTAPAPPVDPSTGTTWVNAKTTEANSEEGDLMAYFLGWWLDQMMAAPSNLTEKMVYFYHTHFTTRREVVRSSASLYHQNALFRYYALGNFKEVCKKICLDNAMLVFLDGRLNVVGRTQENFGREFLELYTIGKGPQIGPEDYTTYTEQDVQQAARVLTGYVNDDNYATVDPDTLIRTGYLRGNGLTAGQHDAEPKVFSNKFGGAIIQPSELIDGRATVEATLDELDQMVTMIFDQQETARHICRKLYRFFCYYRINDEVEQDIISGLADTFIQNDFELLPVLEQLMSSTHFFDEDNAATEDNVRGSIIKSPLEMNAIAVNYFGLTFPADDVTRYTETHARGFLRFMEFQGMSLYDPPEVAGYAAYHQTPEYNRNWISANNLARRYQMVDFLMNGENASGDPLGAQLDIVAFVRDEITDPSDATIIVSELVEDLLPEIITAEREAYYLEQILLDDLSLTNWRVEWLNYIQTGDDAGVRAQLESLVRALMQSPEYQLM